VIAGSVGDAERDPNRNRVVEELEHRHGKVAASDPPTAHMVARRPVVTGGKLVAGRGRAVRAEVVGGHVLGQPVARLGVGLRAEQQAGRVAPQVDPEAAALMLIGACFMRAYQRQMLGSHVRTVPSLDRVVTTLDAMLAPVPTDQRSA